MRDPGRAVVLGCPVDRLTFEETVAAVERVVEERGFAQHVCVNAAKLVALRRDPRLREIVAGCELVSADGVPVVWASRLLGDPLPERVNGTDLMERLLADSERRGWGVYLLGARRDVLERAVERLRERHPALRIAGYRDGWFPDSEAAAVAEEVRAAAPDLLFVAISSPRKELWLAEHGRGLGVPFVMGVGGSVDIVAGMTRRAPRWMQRTGLEWLFRLVQEPRRLGRRYLVTNAQFLALVGRDLVRRRFA
jgi:N-acetylglucosaminyldiphosphoundecaprenol N-acetyl-beta-D-mannosaminyltransferase